ncbi:hypothetical protein FMEXI_13917 [Fusarium mexicanum]|uniref:Uncharacterized protein n=1 Tax=Fusarium mexicanum TaxID=751941 RepID=A0A8H5I5B6_9HYPO|nr:hypothetical protein FMEXI_13917 [Fusarium mexicanum]
MPTLRPRGLKSEASMEGNPNVTPSTPANKKRQHATPSKAARWSKYATGTPMERLDIEESVATLLQRHKTVQQKLEEAEAKERDLRGKKEIVDSFGDSALLQLLAYPADRIDILQSATADTDINVNQGAIKSLLDKERQIQELADELAFERDTVGKELQRHCDADLRRAEVEIGKLREEERDLKSRVDAIVTYIEPYAHTTENTAHANVMAVTHDALVS